MTDWVGRGSAAGSVTGGAFGLLPEELDTDITVYPRAGNSATAPLFGENYCERAYIEPGYKAITDNRGRQVLSSLFAVVGPDSKIVEEDEILYAGKRYRVASADQFLIGGAVCHTELRFVSVSR